MATNDLMTELQKDSIKLDDDSERKVGGASCPGGAGPASSLKSDWWRFGRQVVRMILKLLEDKNGEVQNLAVKWWAELPRGGWGWRRRR